MFKKLFDRMTNPVHIATPPSPPTFTSTVTIPASTTIPAGSVYSIGTAVAGNITAAAPAPSAGQFVVNTGLANILGGAIGGGGGGNFGTGMFQQVKPTSIISLFGPGHSKEIVKLNLDGSVEWANGIDIDAAAEAFSRSLSLGAEQAAGITQRVKLGMRDSVFEDLIKIAKDKGSLTAEDLTYLLEASKIVEKLKGGN